MKKGIILYQSKYGATQKYANWLSDKTGFDCIAVDKADMKQIHDFAAKRSDKHRDQNTNFRIVFFEKTYGSITGKTIGCILCRCFTL